MGHGAGQDMEMEIHSVAARLTCCPFSVFLSSEAILSWWIDTVLPLGVPCELDLHRV